jgi:hypothetical protein
LQAVEQAHVAQYARAVRYDRGVNESFVDLTYRGLSLGRRLRLTQVRPTTGYVELPAPMPVGTPVAIATDDGAGFEATVIEIHEQVGGSERPPGMTVAPALATEAAEAWWRARITLGDDGGRRPRAVTAGGRTRPPTVRPRSHTTPAPPARGATAETPAIAADLDARVAAAAGVAVRNDGDRAEMRTLVMPLAEVEALAAASGGDGDPATTLQMRQAGDPDAADDAGRTTIMASIDPEMFGAAMIDSAMVDSAAQGGEPATAIDREAGPDDAGRHAGPDDAGHGAGSGTGSDAGDGDDDGSDADVTDPGGAPGDTLDESPAAAPGRRRRRRRSRR